MSLQVTRLSISLPPFSRLSWASRAAADTWAPRLATAAEQWPQAVLALATEGPAPVLAVAAKPDLSHRLRALAARSGMVVVPVPTETDVRLLPWRAPSLVLARTSRRRFLVGRRPAVEAAAAALRDGDSNAAFGLLAVPDCCRAFHERAMLGWEDPWWPVARNTAVALGEDAAVGARGPTGAGPWELDLPAHCSRVLLRAVLNLPTVWYVPCTLTCSHASEHDAMITRAMETQGFLSWTGDVDSWPVAWSGLHGIAELKTPIFKLIEPTDPTAEHLIVRLTGNTLIDGAARGVRFPFVAQPRRRLRVLHAHT